MFASTNVIEFYDPSCAKSGFRSVVRCSRQPGRNTVFLCYDSPVSLRHRIIMLFSLSFPQKSDSKFNIVIFLGITYKKQPKIYLYHESNRFWFRNTLCHGIVSPQAKEKLQLLQKCCEQTRRNVATTRHHFARLYVASQCMVLFGIDQRRTIKCLPNFLSDGLF